MSGKNKAHIFDDEKKWKRFLIGLTFVTILMIGCGLGLLFYEQYREEHKTPLYVIENTELTSQSEEIE